METDLVSDIRRFVIENLLYVDDVEYDNDSSFIGGGLLDSMGVMELVAFVQSFYSVAVEPQELIPENFDSVNKLASFIERKRSMCLERQAVGDGHVGPGRP